MAKKFLLISPKNRPTYNFRGDLLKSIIAKGYEVVATGPDTENEDRINELGVRLIVVPLSRNGTSIINDIKYYIALKNVIKEERPDITLGYTIKPSIYGALAAHSCSVKGIYSMITGAGYTFTSKNLKAKVLHKIVSILYKRALKKTKAVFFQNPDDMQMFIQSKLVESEKCVLVGGSGVNMKHYTPLPHPNNICFLMIARVMYCKGILEYLKAAKIVKVKHPNARFMLLGAVETIQDSVPMDVLTPYIDNGVIEYFGETKDVRPYFAQSSVYVLPSYREGTPRTVLEAMSMCRPIITTDVPGCRQTVIDGVNGYLVPAKDEKALADAMINFIENPSLIEAMGIESHKLCEEKFEVGKVNDIMIKTMNV